MMATEIKVIFNIEHVLVFRLLVHFSILGLIDHSSNLSQAQSNGSVVYESSAVSKRFVANRGHSGFKMIALYMIVAHRSGCV